MSTFCKLTLQYVIPQKLLTQLMGFLANSKNKLVKNSFIKIFYSLYDINMSEAVEAEILNYASFHDFFIRRLHPSARPIDSADNSIVSTADGKISQIGHLEEDKLIQAKGRTYDLLDLLAGDAELAEQFVDGAFNTTYLAPNNYHRVHMPITGSLRKMIYVPGKLFSVSPFTAENVPNLFARNERVICIFDTEVGPMAVILVGAMIVGSVTTVWAGQVTPPRKGKIVSVDYPSNTIKLEKGAELGYFSLGSTTITLFAKDAIVWEDSINPTDPVRMGQAVARSL